MQYREIHTDNFRVGVLTLAENFGNKLSGKKERERKGQKVLMAEVFPQEDIRWTYEESGKPYFTERTENLSFSHSENVFVCQIGQSFSCGIDVQHYREKIYRVADKFLGEEELSFVASVPETEKVRALTAMWCCKESLYKMYGKGFIDYLNLFHVQPFSVGENGIIRAIADLGNGNKEYLFYTEFTDEYVLAFHTL